MLAHARRVKSDKRKTTDTDAPWQQIVIKEVLVGWRTVSWSSKELRCWKQSLGNAVTLRMASLSLAIDGLVSL